MWGPAWNCVGVRKKGGRRDRRMSRLGRRMKSWRRNLGLAGVEGRTSPSFLLECIKRVSGARDQQTTAASNQRTLPVLEGIKCWVSNAPKSPGVVGLRVPLAVSRRAESIRGGESAIRAARAGRNAPQVYKVVWALGGTFGWSAGSQGCLNGKWGFRNEGRSPV